MSDLVMATTPMLLGRFSKRLGQPTAPNWSKLEDATLRDNACNGYAALAEVLPARTLFAIKNRAHKLGVPVKARSRAGGAPRWRGRLPIPVHAQPLVRRFYREMNREKTLIQEIADRCGVAYDTISDWRYRRVPRLDNFIAALNALDLDLAIIPKRGGE